MTAIPPFNPQPGDVVQLRSGGCQMTVSRADGDFWVCVWHDEYGRPRCEPYRTITLMPAVDEEARE